MPIKKTDREIEIISSPDEFILSVSNPEHPIFRLHTQHTNIVLSSSFYEFKGRCLLPSNSIVFSITTLVAKKVIMEWVSGIQFKRYCQFKNHEHIYLEFINNGIDVEVFPILSLSDQLYNKDQIVNTIKNIYK